MSSKGNHGSRSVQRPKPGNQACSLVIDMVGQMECKIAQSSLSLGRSVIDSVSQSFTDLHSRIHSAVLPQSFVKMRN